MPVRASLQVGGAADPAEREAEAMASRVVASSPPATPAALRRDEPVAASPLRREATGQPDLDSLVEPEPPAEQADVEVAPGQDVPLEAVAPADTGEMESGAPEPSAGEPPAPDLPPVEDAPPPVMAAHAADAPAVGRAGGPAPPDVAARVAGPGAGTALPRGLRDRLAPFFGRDFAEVRLHDTPTDRAAAARIGARAFAHGRHIWLGPGESTTDTRLMAHELTHVAQQTAAPERSGPSVARSPAPLRREGWLEEKGEGYARHIPGYTLLTVILGQTLISRERVAMTAEALLGGFMGLLPGGTAMFDRLNETRALPDAFDWVRGKLDELDLTWSRVEGLLDRIWDAAVSLSPVENLTALFRPLVADTVRFAGEIAGKILEFVVRGALRLAGPHADRVWAILQQARESLSLILEDPLGFAMNLVRAVVGGFTKFGANILDHLKRGLLGWLFGALSSAGISLPERLDFKGLVSIVLQVLGLTYEAFRARLVRALGAGGERKVALIERSAEVVKLLVREGFLGLWQRLLSFVDGFRQTLIGGLTEMVVGSVVKAGIKWLAGLTNPAGAVVRVVLAIYDMIVVFLERLEQIMAVAQSVFSSIGAIARGQVQQAIDFVEQTIGRTVPVVISFLAGLLGLNDIPRRIQDVLRRLQAPVARALDRLAAFLMRHAKRLFAALIGKVNALRGLPSHNFRVGRKQHRIFTRKAGRGKVDVFIASGKGHQIDAVKAANTQQLALIRDPAAKDAAGKLAKETDTTDTKTETIAIKVKPDSETESQRGIVASLDAALQLAAAELEKDGAAIDDRPETSSQTEGPALFRAAEPRSEAYEGMAGTWTAVNAEGQKPFNSTVREPKSRYYEADHTIEKQFAKHVLDNLHLIDPAAPVARKAEATVTAPMREALNAGQKDLGRNTATRRDDKAKPFGLIGTEGYQQLGENAGALPAVAVYHRNHLAAKGKGLTEPAGLIDIARSKPDPHRHLASSLKKQLKAELSEMQATFDAAAAPSPLIAQRMKAGLATMEASNTKLFGLEGVSARRDSSEERAAKAKDPFQPQEGGSVFAMKGGGRVPDFGAEEGRGGDYAELPKARGDFFERDHIVDKAWPLNAQTLPLLDTDRAAALRDALTAERDGQPPTEKQAARIAALQTAKLFPADSRMARYTADTGYAVAIYRPLALEVTSRTGAGARKDGFVTGIRREKGLRKALDFVRTGEDRFVSAARDDFAGSVHERFVARTEAHGRAVAELYGQEIGRVTNLNPPESRAAATRAMSSIAQTVRSSLLEARQRTDTLF